MTIHTSVRPRVDVSARTAVLLAGDAVALGAFAWAGEVRHGYPPAANPLRYLGTLAPFLLAWLGVAVAAGLYTEDWTTTLRGGLRRAGLAWLVALPLAHGLRVVAFHGGTSPAFFAVSGLVGGGLLLTWRAAATWL